MSWPSRPTTMGAGGRLRAEDIDTVNDRIEFLSTIPAFHLRQTVAQSIPSGTGTPVNFDVEDLDNLNGHSTVTNTSRYTVQTGCAGWWWLSGGLAWASNGTGRRGVWYKKNGTDLNGTEMNMYAVSTGIIGNAARGSAVQLAVGDYVELSVLQESGGALNTGVTATQQPSFSGFLLIPTS